MIVITGCHGIHTISICVSPLAFNSGFIRYENGLKSVIISANGKLDQGKMLTCTVQYLHPRNKRSFHRKSEIIALIIASLLGMPGGSLLFMVFYHPLHDFYNVPSEITSISILMVATAIVWKFDRKSERYEKPAKMDRISKILFAHLIIHYLVNLGTAIFINPEDVISIGLHQKIGNCNETEPVHTILKVHTLIFSNSIVFIHRMCLMPF